MLDLDDLDILNKFLSCVNLMLIPLHILDLYKGFDRA